MPAQRQSPRSATPVAGISHARKAVPTLAAITILALIFPLNTFIGSLFITPSRLLFLFTVPYLLLRWIKGDFNGILPVDWMVIAYVFWMTITIAYHHPPQAVTFVGTTALIILGGYLTGRATIRTVEDFQALIRFLAMIVLCMLPFAIYEAVTEHSIILETLADIPGFNSYEDVNYCCRLGLDRAQVVFVHPIHFGIFASLPFGLYFFALQNQVGMGKRVITSLLIGVATFLSISSGPFLALVFQGGLVAYGVARSSSDAQWRSLLIGCGLIYALIEINTTHFGLFAIASKLAFNSGTAYVRSLLFEYGIDQVKRTPFLGLGYNRIPMPAYMTGSVDNFWLLLATVHGLPAFFACFGAFLYSAIRAGKGKLIKGSDLYNARVGWTVLLIGLMLALATVAIWSEVHSMVFLMLGAGQFLFYAQEPDGQLETTETEDVPRKEIRFTRFPKKPSIGNDLPASADTRTIPPDNDLKKTRATSRRQAHGS